MIELLEYLFEWIGDLFEWIGDLFDGDVVDVDPTAVGGGAAAVITAFDVISTVLLIQGVLYVASLTADSIQSELSNRRELKDKGVQHVQVLQEFINQSGYTEISLAALNAQNKQVGTVRMQTKGYTNVKKGDIIRI